MTPWPTTTRAEGEHAHDLGATAHAAPRGLERYPAQRYPIQHATAQFHLGVALTQAGDLPRAETALATAAQLFDAAGMATEQREELQRWVDAPVAERRVEAGAWIDGNLARGDTAAELAVAWVGALLELPPAAMEAVMRSVVEALAQREAEAQQRFRADVARVSARFTSLSCCACATRSTASPPRPARSPRGAEHRPLGARPGRSAAGPPGALLPGHAVDGGRRAGLARAGADDGAVVVAGYQAAPRGRALHDALLAKHGASVIVGACGCRCHGVSVG